MVPLAESCCVVVELLSHVQLFVTPWTVARQSPLSMGFSRQEYWSGLPFPSPGNLPNPGIKPMSPASLLHGRWIVYHWAIGDSLNIYFFLKTIDIYSLIVLESRSLKSVSLGQKWGVRRTSSRWRLQGRICTLPLSSFRSRPASLGCRCLPPVCASVVTAPPPLLHVKSLSACASFF